MPYQLPEAGEPSSICCADIVGAAITHVPQPSAPWESK
jgi:hypothetical protein